MNRIPLSHEDVEIDIRISHKQDHAELIHKLFDIHTTSLAQGISYHASHTIGRVPLTYYVYDMILKYGGGGQPSHDLDEIAWFTNTYEKILMVNAWNTHEYIVTGHNELKEEIPRYHFGWYLPNAHEDMGNIVSSKNPRSIQIRHNGSDINWALIALDKPVHTYKTHDFLSETKGMIYRAFEEYFQHVGYIVEKEILRSTEFFVGDNAVHSKITLFIVTGDNKVVFKEWMGMRWCPSSGHDHIHDAHALSIIAELFPESVPKPLIRWLIPNYSDEVKYYYD